MVNSSNPKRSAASMRLLASATVCLPAAMAAGRLGKVILQTHDAKQPAGLACSSTDSMLHSTECDYQILSTFDVVLLYPWCMRQVGSSILNMAPIWSTIKMHILRITYAGNCWSFTSDMRCTVMLWLDIIDAQSTAEIKCMHLHTWWEWQQP